MTIRTSNGLGKLVKRLGQRFLRRVNRAYRRDGTLRESRARGCLTGHPIGSSLSGVENHDELSATSIFGAIFHPGIAGRFRAAINGGYVLSSSQLRAHAIGYRLGTVCEPTKSQGNRTVCRRLFARLNN